MFYITTFSKPVVDVRYIQTYQRAFSANPIGMRLAALRHTNMMCLCVHEYKASGLLYPFGYMPRQSFTPKLFIPIHLKPTYMPKALGGTRGWGGAGV